MNKMEIFKLLFASLIWLIAANVFALDDMAWFKNELTCAGTKITVKSYCREEAEQSANTLCTMQTLILELPDKKKIERNLLEKEPSRGYFHSVRGLTCVTANDKNYLYLSLGNGGNCTGCENDAVIDLYGQWKRYGTRWYVSSSEKKDIARCQAAWFKQESVLLNNKIKE